MSKTIEVYNYVTGEYLDSYDKDTVVVITYPNYTNPDLTVIYCPFNRSFQNEIKDLYEARFNGQYTCWVIPVTDERLNDLIEEYYAEHYEIEYLEL